MLSPIPILLKDSLLQEKKNKNQAFLHKTKDNK